MAKVIYFCITIILILSLLGRGFAAEQCDLRNLQYKVERTGRLVKDKTQYNVAIYHTCKECSLGNIVFGNCMDWKSSEHVDPAIFRKDGNLCLVNSGKYVKPGENVSFSFAWDSPVNWVPNHADVQC